LLLRQSQRPPRRWGDQGWETLSEDRTPASGIVAEELAGEQMESDDEVGPG
jgi:hypothetical protein